VKDNLLVGDILVKMDFTLESTQLLVVTRVLTNPPMLNTKDGTITVMLR
jgi:hypothetical protein